MKAPFTLADATSGLTSLFRGSVNGDRHAVAKMTWDAIEARIKTGAVALLPIGAGSKEHGLHLPMNTDQIQAEFFAARIAEKIDALIWPTVAYGHYPAFVDYPGSSSLSAPVYESLIAEIAAGILASGVRALIVIDTGISTIAPTERALASFKPSDVLHLRVHQGARYRAAASRLAEQRHGSHADELETSLMLAIAPHEVTMARAEASPADRINVLGPLTRSDSSSPSYSPSGSFGDPTLATRAKGDVLLAAMMEDVIGHAQQFAARQSGDSAERRTGSGSTGR
jgi:creatinine amidohydrolase